MIIKNKKDLATTDLRRRALDIVEAGIDGVLVDNVMSVVKYSSTKKILSIKNSKYKIKGRIFIIGGGKPSGAMAEILEKIIGAKNITAGFVNCITSNYKTSKIKIIKASHPVPDKRGVQGVDKMLALKEKYNINKDDLIVCLISGGGSALMPHPIKNISLKDKQHTTELLLRSGADINNINAVRKHLSAVKGGQLGKFFAPSRVVSLILSDVIGDDLSVIASGPTVPDKTTFKDAYEVLKKYSLINKTPKNVIKHIRAGMSDSVDETPKFLKNCHNHIVGNNKLALNAMQKRARKTGLRTRIITDKQKGDPAKLAVLKAKEVERLSAKGFKVMIIGGETTPIVPKNHGKGGRNQHYIAKSLLSMRNVKGEWALVSIGTDGSDFMHNIAGAIIDNNSLKNSGIKKLELNNYIKKFNSNALLKKVGNSLVKTGNTGTNVCDIIVYIFK